MKINRRGFLGAAGAGACTALIPKFVRAQSETSAGSMHSWPSAHILPRFPSPRHLLAGDIASLTGDQQILLTTLQGAVNARCPELYWFLAGDGTDQTWLNTLRVPHELVDHPLAMVNKYRNFIEGAIVYDPNLADTINVATSLAGLRNAVVATEHLARRHKLPIVEDLRGRFTDKFAAYSWLIDNHWPELNHRLLTAISPANPTINPAVAWTKLLEVSAPVTDASNKDTYTANLSGLLGGQAVYVRFQDAYPNDGWGPSVDQVTVLADGNVIASFQPGTAAEQPFLYEADSSQLASGWRFADGANYFIYRFTPPAGTRQLTLQTHMWNEFLVTATNMPPVQYIPFPNLRDYIVATKALVVWLDPLVSSEADFLATLLAKFRPNTPYLGWFPGGHEDAGVTLLAQHGITTVAADFFNNGTVFGGVETPVRPAQPIVSPPALQNKVYVTFTMSEGDNLQYCQHRLRSLWDDPGRGKTPLNWSISPLLLDAAPAFLTYFQSNQTTNDFFVAGPSGVAYTYPGVWPSNELPVFTKATGSYMRRIGLDVIYALNRTNDTNVDLSPAVAQQYENDVRLLGILSNWISTSQLSRPIPQLPVMTQIGISSVAEGQSTLATATEGWAGDKPLFVAIGVLAWNMTPTDINTLVASLGSQYEVVRADVFFTLLRQTLGISR